MRRLWLVPLSFVVAISLGLASSANSPSTWLATGEMQKTVIEIGAKNFSTGDKYCEVRTEYELQYPAVNGVRILGFPKKEPVEACWYETEYGSVGYANRLSRLYVKDVSRGENVIRVTGQPAGLWASLGKSGYLMFQTSISGSYKRLNLYDNTKQRLIIFKTGWYDQYAYDGTSNRWTLPGFNGNPLGTNATGYSQNGDWIVAETSHGFMRINTQTKDTLMFGALLFGYGYGQDPSHELTISNDGRYAVVAGGDINRKNFHLYDLASCVKGLDPLAVATGCIKRDIKADAFAELAANKSVSRIIFGSDASYLTYNFQIADGTVNRMLLTAPGREVHLMEYIALGDSYTSGEGEYEGGQYYLPGTDGDGKDLEGIDNKLFNYPYGSEKCHLSKRSYPYLLSTNASLINGQFASIACSGSTTKDVKGVDEPELYFGRFNQYLEGTDLRYTEQEHRYDQSNAVSTFIPGRAAQVEFIKKYKPKVATIGIGGNDIGFAGKLESCLFPGTCDWEGRLRNATGVEIQGLYGNLSKTFQALSVAGPTTKFYVLGYPQIVSLSETCSLNVRLNFEERTMARQMVMYMNEVIENAARSAGFTYIDVEDALQGKQLCDVHEGDKAIRGVLYGNDQLGIFGNESFHPTHVGHARIAEVIMAQIGGSSIIDHEPCVLLGGLRCPGGPVASPPIPSYFTAYASETAQKPAHVVDAELFNSVYEVGDLSSVKTGEEILLSSPTIDDSTEVFAPNQSAEVQMYSDPMTVGNVLVDSTGKVSGSITIPSDTLPGYHTLTYTIKNSLYEDIMMYQQIFVYSSRDDFDGDGVLNSQEECGMFEAIGQDADRDGVDDSCDETIAAPRDTTAPIVTAVIENLPNTKGWYDQDVSVRWFVNDETDGELAVPALVASIEGEQTYESEEVCDTAGNCAKGSVTLKIDKTPPAITSLTFSKNPKSVTDISELVANIDDNNVIESAQYFIGETGNLGYDATMHIIGSQANTVFGTDFPIGVYKISVRAQDVAGNWSAPSSDYLVVYDPASGLRVHGARTVDISSNDNDLPWLDQQVNSFGKFAFSVRYGTGGTVTPQSDFQFSYSVGEQCGSKQTNCRKVELNASKLNWLTTNGLSSETGIFSGVGTLKYDSEVRPVSFVVAARDGQRAGSVSNDTFALSVYDGEMPYTSPLLYYVLPTEVGRGNIFVKQ